MRTLLPRVRNGFLEPTFDDLYQIFDSFFVDKNNNLSTYSFKVDLQNNEKDYIIDADLPGISKDDLKITLEDDRLTIGFELNSEKIEENKNKNFVHKERRYRSMSRSFYLPDSDPENVEASLKDGVLNIKISKKVSNAKSIEIGIN